MTDTQQFLEEMMPRIQQAETALHNGDPGPRLQLWSHVDPVSVFGAAFSPIGWAEVGPMFEELASPSQTAAAASGKSWQPMSAKTSPIC